MGELMVRPVKCRRVNFTPGVSHFAPVGIPVSELEETVLTLEEIEALRLKDIEGMEQEEGAASMNVSRPTFQRVLTSARQKITDAIINGKAIKIEGGNFEIAPGHYRCAGGREWELPFPNGEGMSPPDCPRRNNEGGTLLQPLHGCRKLRTGVCPWENRK